MAGRVRTSISPLAPSAPSTLKWWRSCRMAGPSWSAGDSRPWLRRARGWESRPTHRSRRNPMIEQVYEDRWGEIFDRPSIDVIEVRWFDTTADMTAPEFQAWLSKFAECVERRGRGRVLIDSTTFRMSPAQIDRPS